MTRLNITVFIFALLCIIIGFFIGWLNPVEGPYDYLYDNYASQPAHKRPVSVTPEAREQLTVSITDLSLDDLELLEEIFERSRGQ